MKIFVKDDRIVTTAKDTTAVEVSGCQMYYVPDGTRLWRDDRPVNFSDLEVTQEASDIYGAQAQLQKSDPEMARVNEDLIDLLVSKGVITLAELPAEAQAKIAARQAMRAVLQ